MPISNRLYLSCFRTSFPPSAVLDVFWHPAEEFKHWIGTAPTSGKLVLWNLTRDGNKRREVRCEGENWLWLWLWLWLWMWMWMWM